MSPRKTHSNHLEMTKIDHLEAKLNAEIKHNQIKLWINKIGSKIVSWSSIFLNISTIILSLTAIGLLFREINEDNSKLTNSAVIMPLIVAVFTLLLFVISITLMIYSGKNKLAFYEEQSQLIQHLILKSKYDPHFGFEELLASYNQMLEQIDVAEKNLSYKKIIKKALEQRNGKK